MQKYNIKISSEALDDIVNITSSQDFTKISFK